MADVSASDDLEENILYDLTIAAEWPLEPETVNRNVKEKSQFSLKGRLTSVAYRTLWTFLRSIGISMRTASPCNLPIELVRLVNSHIHWHLAVSRDGRHLAVLQDQLLEIRSSKDEFAAVGRCPVTIDPYPQWRTVAWSHAGDMIACSGSAGDVNVFDIAGTSIVYIPSTVVPNPNSPVDLSHAVVELVFKEYNSKEDIWQEELLVINYQGALHSYLISMQGTFCLNHKYSFSVHYPRGLSCSVFLPSHDLLVLGGPAAQCDSPDAGPLAPSDCGLSLWRCLSDYPHYKMVTDYEQDVRATQATFVNRLRNLTFPNLSWRRNGQDGIFHMSCSPDGKMVAAIHYSGTISVWHVPSFRLATTWPLEEQPGYDEMNPEVLDNPRLKKQMKDSLKAFHLMDANWWSDEAIITVRGTGALAVSSVKTLRNLLGTSPEWFAPAPAVSPAIDGGFMALECEAKLSNAKRRLVSETDTDDYEDSDDELDATMVTKTTKYVKWMLHYVTDIERFQPPRKRPKVMNKTYRLINLKSTTPEELYHRKIKHEEYGEALALAKVYGLDCDLVYQCQWRKTPVSVASIQDYLSKISKRSWVLNDCMERVPENIDAMRELLQYGLRGTDLEALQAIGRNEDGGRFILCDVDEAYEESLDYLDEEALEEVKERAAEKRRELAASVDFSCLSLEQRELCRARVKFLQYIDRLSTYEEILGGIHAAEERFDPKFFEEFRSQNIVELALNYARQCDWRALEVLLTYHGSELLKHRLGILSNFPETFAPSEYRSLLPEAGWRPDDAEVLAWEEGMWRQQDWVEMDECRAAINSDPQDPGAFLYEENSDLAQFIGDVLTQDQLTLWYIYRAEQIEQLARQVEHSLELIRYGRERNIQGLDRIHDDLVTMETLVYECEVDDSVTFKDLQAMTDIDKLRLIMSTSTDEMYMKNVRRWLVPFLERCEKHTPGTFTTLIREYMVTLAKDDLTCCRKVIESSKADQPNPVIAVDQKLISIALECIYTCESNDQLSNAFGILECLPQRGFGVVSEASTRLHNQVDELEDHLSAAETLEKHGLPHTIADIRATQNDEEEAKKLFTKLTRIAGRRSPPLKSDEWEELLLAMLDLRDKVYRCVQSNVCYEIFVESLLCSSRPENIRLAGERMERSLAEATEPDYPVSDSAGTPLLHKVAYSRAVDLVLSAAQEYFNSSAALTDNCMELARQCLNLITDQPAVVAEELDLIESLALLAGFGVSMLPLQVRMTNERLDLIQKAIDAKPYTYKNSQRLLRLARLLRVKGNNEQEREGQVLKLVAQAGLKAKDQRVAHDTCRRLMAAGYAPVWEECKTLAQEESFTDTRAKVELLSFAVTHCTEDMLEPILRAKCYLETQILYEHLQRSGPQEGLSPTRETSPFSARAALEQTQELLTATTTTTRTVLSAVSDRRWWARTMQSLHPAAHHHAGLTEQWDDRNAAFTRQGCHPFYAHLMEAAYTNNSEADYRGLRLRPAVINGLQFSEAVLHLGSLEQMLTEGATDNSSTAVLLQLAEDVIHQDCSLGLSYLLALPEPLDADPVFKKLPRTAISLQLATYYYALQLTARLIPNRKQHQAALYAADPADVIAAMLGVTEDGGAALPADLAGLVEKLQHYNELMTDFTQAQVLESLSKGVDVARFTQDNEYKRETILGLAMTTEQTVYETALSLAKRYKLPMWELYMTHLEHLFECGLPLVELEQRVVEQGLMHALSERPDDLARRMVQFVYPSIAGTDHGRLLYYYSLLDTARAPDQRVPPDTHMRLLKKIRPAAPGLDYKKLMDATQRPLEVIRPILNDGNVHVLAKLAPRIPDQRGGFLQPSLVFCAWAVKLFWGSDSDNKNEPQNKTEWIHRYEACGEYIQKLCPDDIAQFIEAIVFVPQSLDKLGLECRQEIVRRAIKFCKQGGKKKKGNPSTKSDASWEDIAVRMQESLDHLNHLDNPVIVELAEAEDAQLHNYARLFDLSRSESDKVHELCVRMVLDGQPCHLVADMLTVLPGDTWQPQTAVKEAISLIVCAIRDPENLPSLLEGRDLMRTLQTVVHSVHDGQQESDLVSVDDVMTLLRPFCADVTVPVQPRLDVLHILEQEFELNEEDFILLICYRTDAIISSGWGGKKVTDAEVGTDVGRQALFDSLLSTSEHMEQFMALTKLLDVWPPLAAIELRAEDPEKHPWCQVIVAMVTQCKHEAVPHVLKITEELKESKPLSVQCVRFVFDTLVTGDMWLAAIKVALISGHTELHEDVLEQLAKQDEASDDSVLCQLLLQHHLVARVVNTPYYPLVVEYVISKQTPGEEMPYYLSVETIANQLQELGHVAEAGSLLMTYRGTHSMLRTFDMTYSVLSRWFKS